MAESETQVSKFILAATRWYSRIARYYAVVVAPKLEYKLERVECYRDGVWIDFSLKNKGVARRFVTPRQFRFPLLNPEFMDQDAREWEVLIAPGTVNYAKEDTFIGLEPGREIRYRMQVSSAKKPLRSVGPAKRGGMSEKPVQLTYSISGWVKVYTQLTEQGHIADDMYAIGFGKVPVRWHDEDSPSLMINARLLGSGR